MLYIDLIDKKIVGSAIVKDIKCFGLIKASIKHKKEDGEE